MVHPQSIIHSLVCFMDGSTKAQLGVPDMKIPIQYALSVPERWPAPFERLDWSESMHWDLEPPDRNKFPCLDLAREALRAGGTAPAALNAANEQAVSLFLRDALRFTDIPGAIARAMARMPIIHRPSLDDLVACDAESRRLVMEHIRVDAI